MPASRLQSKRDGCQLESQTCYLSFFDTAFRGSPRCPWPASPKRQHGKNALQSISGHKSRGSQRRLAEGRLRLPGPKVGRTPKGSYSSRERFSAPSANPLLRTPYPRTLLSTVKPIAGPLLRTLLRTFPRTLPRTFSEPFLERCVAVRPLRRAPNKVPKSVPQNCVPFLLLEHTRANSARKEV